MSPRWPARSSSSRISGRGAYAGGLWAALVAGIVSAVGFGLEAVEADAGELPVILAVAGAVVALGGLVLAFFAWTFAHRQRRGRRGNGTPA